MKTASIARYYAGEPPADESAVVARSDASESAEREYLEKRAEAELAAAQAARHPAAVRAHYVLASEYLERLYWQTGEGEHDACSEAKSELK